ncbi:ETC complex I subunit [Pseudochelatococcus sp. G4_1912]|uniref:ETC complex I subunit n=1 Tax=Pseudochelatococcus sp. G4_1912 TaxID=3114288 RepID=UPI0039C63595
MTVTARIYKPTRNAMQSGTANRRWLLAFDATRAREIDPLMGWTSSSDTRQQLRLWFDTKEEAIDYAKREGIPFRLEEDHEPNRRILSYSDNFKFNRIGAWTH